MGEVIIKVPEDVKEVIDLGIPYKRVKEKIEELEKEERIKSMIEFFQKYKGSVEIGDVKEEDIYLQGD